MLSTPAALKGCNFFMTLEISFLEIDFGKGISAGYEALGISVRSAFNIVGRTLTSGLLLF
jgi:hypothetical protein